MYLSILSTDHLNEYNIILNPAGVLLPPPDPQLSRTFQGRHIIQTSAEAGRAKSLLRLRLQDPDMSNAWVSIVLHSILVLLLPVALALCLFSAGLIISTRD